jgi:hypothetical protein
MPLHSVKVRCRRVDRRLEAARKQDQRDEFVRGVHTKISMVDSKQLQSMEEWSVGPNLHAVGPI